MPRTLSVVVTCYNFRRYIAETLHSLADQTRREFEAIVVDNNSTDGSIEIIEAIAAADPRFVVVREPRQGVHHALNAGIARASGDVVLLLDGDDLYRPERLARTLETFEATDADFVACNGQRINARRAARRTVRARTSIPPRSSPAVMCQYNPIWTVSFLALTRDALRAIGPMPETCSRILDWHLLMGAFEADLRVAFLDAPLVLKRYHGQNLAFDVETTERQAIPRLHQFMERHEPLRALVRLPGSQPVAHRSLCAGLRADAAERPVGSPARLSRRSGRARTHPRGRASVRDARSPGITSTRTSSCVRPRRIATITRSGCSCRDSSSSNAATRQPRPGSSSGRTSSRCGAFARR